MNNDIKINKKRLNELFKDMVDIYSPSGKEEEITEYLSSYLHDKDLPVTLREVTEGRRNVEVVFSDSRPEIAFIGHIDTVPAFDIEEYACQQEKDTVYGLGTADMKGGCAAMIEAFVAMQEAGVEKEKAALFLVVGEEETGDGTAALLETRSFPWAVVAEPTDMIPCLAHFGYFEMGIRTFGTRRHASQAGKEYNSIFSLLNMLLRLGSFIETDEREIKLNIRDIHSSEAGFAVPASCEAWLDFHLPPGIDVNEFVREIEKLAKLQLEGSKAAKYELDFPNIAPSYQLPDKGLLPDLLRKSYEMEDLDFKPGKFQSHSDANQLYEADCKPIILGPGQLAKAHTSDESIKFSQVKKAAQIYLNILQNI